MRKFLPALLLICSGLAMHAQVITSGLIGYYPFTGNANDSSGMNNHGIVYGATLTNDRFGNPNSAYMFDGVNDYISISPATLLNTTYSYSLWVNASANQTAGMLCIGSTGGDQAMMQTTSLGYGLQTYNYPSGGTNAFMSGPANLQSWYHLVGVRSGTSVSLYVNGQLQSTVATSAAPYYGPSTMYAVIGSRNGTQQYFNGAIDDIGIYNRALDPWEVLAIYNGAVGINDVSGKMTVDVYPNPSNGNTVYLHLDGAQANEAEVTITDMTGRIVHSVVVTDPGASIELPDFAAGMYLVKIKCGDALLSRKLVIE